jgi:hypothetical protein
MRFRTNFLTLKWIKNLDHLVHEGSAIIFDRDK